MATASNNPAAFDSHEGALKTREAWLCRAAMLLAERIMLRSLDSTSYARVVHGVRVSCGWPAGGGTRIGQAWSHKVSDDSMCEIFISPALDEPLRVLDVLLHELCHVAVGIEHGHRAPFKRIARACGLEGKLTATVAGDELRAKLAPIAAELGEYPHAKLERTSGQKKQGTRMLKLVCSGGDACECGGYSVRTTAKWIAVGMPFCPAGTEMKEAD